MRVRRSYVWDVRSKGKDNIMSRAAAEVGLVQSREFRYNYVGKNFGAIVTSKVNIAKGQNPLSVGELRFRKQMLSWKLCRRIHPSANKFRAWRVSMWWDGQLICRRTIGR